MKYSVLGSTGVRVSRIWLGTATFGVAPTAQDADGSSAKRSTSAWTSSTPPTSTAICRSSTGRCPRRRRPWSRRADPRPSPPRSPRQMVIATKSNGIVGHDVNDRGLSRRHVIRQVETSLRRLGTDYIDLYYAHDPDPDTPLEQTLAAYDDLIRQGKIRYVGLSNHPAWQVTHALWIATTATAAPVAVQVKYNLIDRAAERELAPACKQFGLSIVPYAPLHGGLLADLAVLDREVAGDQRFPRLGSPRPKSPSPERSTTQPHMGTEAVPGVAGLATVPPGSRLRHRRRRDARRAPRQRHSSQRRTLNRRNWTP